MAKEPDRFREHDVQPLAAILERALPGLRRAREVAVMSEVGQKFANLHQARRFVSHSQAADHDETKKCSSFPKLSARFSLAK